MGRFNLKQIDLNLFWVSLGIQSPCQMMIGVYNHLLSKLFRFHAPIRFGDWIPRVCPGKLKKGCIEQHLPSSGAGNEA